MKHITFKDFLKSKHAKNYHGLDDDMPDAFDEWLTEIQVDDTILYAFVDEYVAIQKQEIVEEIERLKDKISIDIGSKDMTQNEIDTYRQGAEDYLESLKQTLT